MSKDRTAKQLQVAAHDRMTNETFVCVVDRRRFEVGWAGTIRNDDALFKNIVSPWPDLVYEQWYLDRRGNEFLTVGFSDDGGGHFFLKGGTENRTEFWCDIKGNLKDSTEPMIFAIKMGD